MQCVVDACERSAKVRGLCRSHYGAAHYRGELDRHPRRERATCTVAECGRPAKGRGLCTAHYQRYRTGLELAPPIAARRSAGDVRFRKNGQKLCLGCDHWLPETAYSLCQTTGDGLLTHCRGCNNLRVRGYTYSIGVAEIQRLYGAQGGACAMCRELFDGEYHVDHDHACCSGKKSCGKCVRSLLCPALQYIAWLRQ